MTTKSGTRIRYTKTKDEGILKSSKNMRSNTTGAQYSAILDANEGTYKILNVNSRHYVTNGASKSKNLNVIKRMVKEDLEKLGVSFERPEVRDNSSRVKGKNCAYSKNGDKITKEDVEKALNSDYVKSMKI